MYICKYCEKECKNSNSLKNHERLCLKNSERNYVSHTLGKSAWNKGKTKETNATVAKYSETKKSNYISGKTALSGFATWSKEKKSELAKIQGFGGYQKNAGISQKYKVLDSFNNEVTLQSSYELECSKILNSLNICWVRPKHLKYNNKKYFPDFYLPEYDLYLDPKNDFLAKKDREKIDCVIKQNNVKVYILTKDLLNEEYIKQLVL